MVSLLYGLMNEKSPISCLSFPRSLPSCSGSFHRTLSFSCPFRYPWSPHFFVRYFSTLSSLRHCSSNCGPLVCGPQAVHRMVRSIYYIVHIVLYDM
jgi:hypothetical protein